jgi:protein-disulfide isomerase
MSMISLLRSMLRLSAAMLLMATLTAGNASAQALSAPQRTEVEGIIKDYLLKHPELIEEVMKELEKRQTAAETAKAQKAITDNAQTLFDSPRQVTLGNPKGDVTMVEFFDYNCGYCKRALSDMLDLMKSDPNLKVVLKEFPVLGEGSMQAAQVAVALNMQDKGGKKYLDFHQKLLGARGAADKAKAMAAAKDAGADMARLEKDMASPDVKATLEETFKLAEPLGLNGTPSYVIGKDVVIGAVGLSQLREKVNTARCGKVTC